ncbi:MAG: hypothetical protein RBR09_00925 [Desulfobulbaceae bacterium]|nr:hypothetical protein [Desulfobulbaceae bacterium]MDY0349794.1 hypothetical protein [Desulfobulbaceae bacterium]
MYDYTEKRRSIRDLMEYAVPEGWMEEAEDLLDIYRNDAIALELLHEFYSYLPEAGSDWVREIRLIGRRQGMFLLAAVTPVNSYVYLVSSEGIEFQGILAEGLWDRDILDFFGYGSRDTFREQSRSAERFGIYEPLDSDRDICPGCHAATGELHELGCPVELCPWCGGQLVYCSCRYDQLGAESLSSEEDIIRFEEILDRRGRIPYSPEQRPAYPDEGPGVLIE